MKLIVGLGNPGKQYEKTRHNLGFMVLEHFVKDCQPVGKTVWVNEGRFKSDTLTLEWKPKHGLLEKIIAVKPKTYMNNSGMAVSLFANYYKLESSDIWIVYDDLDLPLGTMKIRNGGASAGHKGVESVIDSLGTDKFWRFRLGIGVRRNTNDHKEGEREHAISRQTIKNAEDYVLGVFSGKEKGKVRELLKNGSKALQESLEHGVVEAMNRFNTK